VQNLLTNEEIREKLIQWGLKATLQRIIIYKNLMNTLEHPTAEKIYDSVRPDNPSISLGTVYKTLDSFTEAGLINKVFTGEGNMRYDANLHQHNHVYCTKSHKIIDFEDLELQELIKKHLKKKEIKNFQIKDFKLQITGEKTDPEQDISIS
jgi:Fur family transcriptional regulator, peroxide stress response regulator